MYGEKKLKGNLRSRPFLDMVIIRSNSRLSSKWYTKPTDTGLTMNFHARFQLNTSTWENFHHSIEKAKTILQNNQYPQRFYEPIISRTLSKIIQNDENREDDTEKEEEVEEKMVFVQYRGRVSEKFEDSLKKLKVPWNFRFQFKMDLPSLKPPIEKCCKSRVVYKICCLRCSSRYVGQTSRHVITRIKEHKRSGPVEIISRSAE